MKRSGRTLAAAFAALCFAVAGEAVAAPPSRPNFLVIVADDLGFSDIGAFGGEIDTPNLDALALSGIRLTGFHTAPTCSPTRSMLLSGTDNHRAGLGNMAELLAPNQIGQPGHEGYLKPNVASLAELLASGGYRTLMSGKWHLGTTPETDPSRRGFQRSFTLLQGGHNHFGLDVSADPAKGYTYREDGKTLASLPKDFYSSDYFATKLIQFLDEGAHGPAKNKPFFAYLTFTAPHWPLQAPPETIAKYRGKYDDGFEALRTKRLKRLAELGLIDPAVAAHSLVFKPGVGGWDSLTLEQKREQSRLMEIYAAMVDRLDRNVGRVIAELKRMGEYENTMILFTADNGAEGLDIRTAEMVGMKERAAKADNRLENLGSATSYLAYGPGWAQAATAPSWLYKGYETEGGTRAVAFLSYRGFQRGNGISNNFGTVMDVVPTFLDLAGIPNPQGQFAGRAVEPIRGTSWASYLSGHATAVHDPKEVTGSELFGSRALRQGDWKLVHLGSGEWQLFNLADDPGETRDLSAQQPQRRAELIALWEAYAKEVGVILPSETVYRP